MESARVGRRKTPGSIILPTRSTLANTSNALVACLIDAMTRTVVYKSFSIQERRERKKKISSASQQQKFFFEFYRQSSEEESVKYRVPRFRNFPQVPRSLPCRLAVSGSRGYRKCSLRSTYFIRPLSETR